MNQIKHVIKLLKEFNRYSKKRVATPGIVITVLATVLFVTLLSVMFFSDVTENFPLGIILGVALSLCLFILVFDVAEKLLLRFIPQRKNKYLFSLQKERLFNLDRPAFEFLALRTVKEVTGEANFVLSSLFYENEHSVVVFSARPGKNAGVDVINMAKKTGKTVIAVIESKDTRFITKNLPDIRFITEADIISHSPELDYEEIKENKKLQFTEIVTAGVANRLITSGVSLFILSVIMGINSVFFKMASISVAAGLVILALTKAKRKALRNP